MAFLHPVPRPFEDHAIHVYAPHVSGVFGISNAREWIFVGEANDIQAALLEWLHRPEARAPGHAPTGFVFEECAAGFRADRCARLIEEYHPAFGWYGQK